MPLFSGNPTKKEAFTLIELLLYIAILSTLAMVLASFLPLVMEARVKRKTIDEVESQGAQAMTIMLQTIRNASGINSPATSTSAGTISLSMASTTLNPTVFDVSAGAIRIKEGTAPAVSLTNHYVSTTALTFWNYSSTTQGMVTIRLDLAYATSSNLQRYQYQKMFYGSAAIRR